MLKSKVFVRIFVLSLLVAQTISEETVNILESVPADSVSRFPHHVVIRIQDSNNSHVCSGSILTEQWILTSLKCVGMAKEFTIEFKRLHLNSTNYVFSVGLNDPVVHRYPTEYDDIALVKLPIKLIFDDELSSVPIANKSDEEIANKFATMPGFNKNNGSDQLNSNMYQIADNSECTAAFGHKYDDFLNICGKEWMYYKSNPCATDLGAGLLINWPQSSELVGIFSAPEICSSNNTKVAIYTNVGKYMDWIEDIVGLFKFPKEETMEIKVIKPPKGKGKKKPRP